MLRVAICDDEAYFRLRERDLIEKYLKETGRSYRIDLYGSGKELLHAPETVSRYDVIFLDISMEEMDGMETARQIRLVSENVCIVFVTAYITYALDGYKVGAVRYLLKEDNLLESAMRECLDAVIDRLNVQKSACVIELQSGKKSIRADDILYVESRLHRVFFFVKEAEITEYSKYDRLDAVEEELRQYGFVRVHQSFLVNMKYVQNVIRYQAILENGTPISISKKYYKNVEAAYIKRQGAL